jgi:hypothetical protein
VIGPHLIDCPGSLAHSIAAAEVEVIYPEATWAAVAVAVALIATGVPTNFPACISGLYILALSSVDTAIVLVYVILFCQAYSP